MQGFLERFVVKDMASAADRERGSFRSFLRKSLRYYLYNVHAHENTQKEGGDRVFVDADDAVLTNGLTPERVFNQSCARALLDRTLARIREEEIRAGHEARFEAVKDWLQYEDAAPMSQTAAALGEKEVTVKVYLHRLRSRHRAIFCAEVAETVERPEDVEREIRELLSAWDAVT